MIHIKTPGTCDFGKNSKYENVIVTDRYDDHDDDHGPRSVKFEFPRSLPSRFCIWGLYRNDGLGLEWWNDYPRGIQQVMTLALLRCRTGHLMKANSSNGLSVMM